MSDAQKPYDTQTAKFIAVLSENMPRLSAEQMQAWIDTKHRKLLQKTLAILQVGPDELTPPVRVCVEDSDERAHMKHTDSPIPLEVVNVPGTGQNPFKALGIYEVDLYVGVEYDSREPPCRPVIRPWLVLQIQGDGPGEGAALASRSCDYWRGFDRSFSINVDKRRRTFLTRSEHIMARDAYADHALEYIRNRYTCVLAYEEVTIGWLIYVRFMQHDLVQNSFRFFVSKQLAREAFEVEFFPIPHQLKK